ncbi:uncharacterized protein LOC115797441 isoform X2 [Archocentrus centrarchus]|uniref:uncharacterized protein LOC115797441 isoform X2 n=1 Tax=Archocentrus centrarchus TaxID=63155 RepID=UPI0011EA4F61|nr:uncharacterized protein LOC115797441 isoform X2 [Archocentrus centrarchus]
MALCFSFRVALLLSLWTTSTCDIPRGVLYTECRERYFMIAAGLSFAGNEPRFEAVDSTGVHAITEQYAAECGYAISFFPLLGRLELRASYFSCHTDNTDDNVFTFNFNLIVTHEGKQTAYALNKTCTLSLPWSPREVTCEVNYMEVSVRSEAACPSENDTDSAFKPSLYSDWQVMFQRADEQFQPMNLSEARKLGYVFALTDGRLVFRTPYEKLHSLSTEVNDVPVEVVHAVLFSRQSWVVVVVDLLAACSMHDGLYYGGYMTWETPEPLHCLVSPLSETAVSIGVDGELVEQAVAEKRGYTVEKYNTTVHIGIPYNAEGGHRKSFVSQDLYEYYIFNLYLEQISVDEAKIAARLRFHRTLVTPLQPHPVFTLNETVPEERVFTIYLGDVPEDVQLVSVQLNGQDVALPLTNASTHNITEVLHPNTTHGYTLKFSRKDVAIQHMLDINYTLAVMPGNEPYHYQTSVMALTPVSPPAFDAVCSESGIRFKLAYRPFDYVWQITIGSDVLTSELAERRGYIMSNNSNTLILDVPLYTQGYQYQDVTLTGFSGTFEILVRDHDTSQVQASTVKTCLFYPPEFIMCSTDGRVTVVANLSLVVPSGGSPAEASLIDKSCGPKDADGTRALFSFPVNGCGAIITLGKEYVTYNNEIVFNPVRNPGDMRSRVTLQCTYAVAGLRALFSVYKFESDTVGVGRVFRSDRITEGRAGESTRVSTRHPTRLPPARPRYQPYAQYIKVSSFLKNLSNKGLKDSSQVNVNAVI